MSELKDYDIMDIEAMDDERLEKSESGKIQVTRVYIKSDVDNAIAELKSALKESEEAIYEAGADAADYYQETRRLKRALWLARAESAKNAMCRYYRLALKEECDPQPHEWSCYINGEVYPTGKMSRKLEPHYWFDVWKEVECKCRAKAEEYK